MRMKKIAIDIVLFLGLLLPMTSSAAEVDTATACRVANRFWSAALQGRGELSAADWKYDGIRLFTSPQGGFVLVAATDCVRPVLGYSPDGHLDGASTPAPLAALLTSWNERILRAEEMGVTSTAVVADEWQRLLSSQPLKEGDDEVQPLLETAWGQTGYYSTLCPDGDPVGCGPLAQAQMMRYWRYPAFGHGSHSYHHNRYGTLSAEFGSTLYDWERMPAQLGAASATAEVDAVATLLYQVGVGVEVDYNQTGSASGAFSHNPDPCINNSLRDYFFYSAAMRVAYKGYGAYSTDQRWADSLAADLRQGHPIVYAGQCQAGGHGWVCDGYQWRDERQFFHFNFGWDGVGDGYYTVDSICPPLGPTGQEGLFLFDMSNEALLGAVPDYRMHLGQDMLDFQRAGGIDSVLFCVSDTCWAPWHVVSSQPWVAVDTTGTGRSGWVRLSADENTSGYLRTARLTFAQGSDTVVLVVSQQAHAVDQYCPLRVTMQSTNGHGWVGGAHLSLESMSGYVFGTAALASGSEGTATVSVAPDSVLIVWHGGGGTDRNVNYTVANQYGETLVAVTNAYYNGSKDTIASPCAHAGIDDKWMQPEVSVWPNPATGVLHVEAPGLLYTELYDLTGRRLTTSAECCLDLAPYAPGPYLLRVVTDKGAFTEQFIKK